MSNSHSFKINDIVSSVNSLRVNGVVKYIACKNATGSIKTCDKKKCNCAVKDNIWVEWPDGKVFSYYFNELKAVELKITSKEDTPVPSEAVIKTGVENIKSVISKKDQDVFWKIYNGFSGVKKDKYGRAFAFDDAPSQTVIGEKELTTEFWDIYNGIKK